MTVKWIMLTYFYVVFINCDENLDVILKTKSSSLETYNQYSDVILMRFIIPENILFASFKFVADETDKTIFGCSPRDVTVYMKHGAPPVINPDGTKFPDSFKNVTRSLLYNFNFKSDKKEHYINITTPSPGSYYVATFLPYRDPRKKAIKQQGLTSECFATVECAVYVREANFTKIAVEGKTFLASANIRENIFYKIYIPSSVDYVLVTVGNIEFSKNDAKLIVRAQNQRIPSQNQSVAEKTIVPPEKGPTFFRFSTEEEKWYYLEFYFDSDDKKLTDALLKLNFSLQFFSSEIDGNSSSKSANNATLFKKPISKLHRPLNITQIIPYKQFNLVRASNSESLSFSYQLESEMKLSMPVPINFTSSEYVALRFPIVDLIDIGGTIQYILAFKPRVVKEGKKKKIIPEPAEHVIVGCISLGHQEIPSWPNKCIYNGVERTSPLVLNKTLTNSTMLIPYPESGTWYATFKLFCGSCKPCSCSADCQKNFDVCVDACERNCSTTVCNDCVNSCKKKILSEASCKECDCDGRCKRTSPSCNSSVLFDISSETCVQGDCGKNGKCLLMVSDGIVYSTCHCGNRYRGWACSDNSLANPYWLVMLELLLLVLSNLMFLPAVYIAFRRKYYIEALCYSAICFFSTFYHSCDAGEHLINYCITRLSALQFADFFCALLAIWVTLMAIADLPSYLPSLFHIGGAIVLAFCTTVNKSSLWIFTMPAIIGVAIIGISWYMKYRKVNQMFLRKQYLYINLPAGLTLVAIGLIIYTALQRENNYMYLHSMWHVLMATAVLILLPKTDTFTPDPVLDPVL